MTKGSDTLNFFYDASGTPMSVQYNGTTYYYVTNIQGDVIAILNGTGVAEVEYLYSAWGELVSTTGSMATTLGVHNPLRYRSYVYDQEYELYYHQSRYYDPEVGRFINADSLGATGQGLIGNNMFVYCNNIPIALSDPNGEFPVVAAVAIAVVAVTAVVAADHSLAKRHPGGVAVESTRKSNGIYKNIAYAKGNGFELTGNDVTLCDFEAGLFDGGWSNGNIDIGFFKCFSARAAAILDWSGHVPNLDVGAIASIYTADAELYADLPYVDVTISGELNVGAIGAELEFDPKNGAIKLTPPSVGIVPSFSVDVDF